MRDLPRRCSVSEPYVKIYLDWWLSFAFSFLLFNSAEGTAELNVVWRKDVF